MARMGSEAHYTIWAVCCLIPCLRHTIVALEPQHTVRRLPWPGARLEPIDQDFSITVDECCSKWPSHACRDMEILR